VRAGPGAGIKHTSGLDVLRLQTKGNGISMDVIAADATGDELHFTHATRHHWQRKASMPT